MPLHPGTAVIISPNLAVADLGDEAVLLDSVSGNYFGLNEVAARILELSKERTTVGQIVDHLLAEYDVRRDALTADVVAFVEELNRNGLVIIEGDER